MPSGSFRPGPAKGAVVITGCSSGIGQACALYLDSIGFQVFAGVRKREEFETLRQKASGTLTPLLIDLTDTALIASAAKTVAEAVGNAGLVGLVNNAGTAVVGPLEFLPLDIFRRQLEINVLGTAAVTQAFLPLLRKGRGRIITVGSISGRSAVPLLGAYCASKSALTALTNSLRLELRPWGIWVSIIEPGRVATPLWQKSLSAAEEQLLQLAPEKLELYGPAINALRRLAESGARRAVPVERVIAAVAHALTSKRPKTRYPVGWGARKQLALNWLPDRVRDWLVAKKFWG